MKQLVILGATGSIGCSTLSVVAQHPDKYQVLALTAATAVDKLFAQCVQVRPRYAAMQDPAAAAELKFRLRQAGLPTEVLAGEQGLIELAAHPDADMVMAAIVGAVLAVARAGDQRFVGIGVVSAQLQGGGRIGAECHKAAILIGALHAADVTT